MTRRQALIVNSQANRHIQIADNHQIYKRHSGFRPIPHRGFPTAFESGQTSSVPLLFICIYGFSGLGAVYEP